MNVPVFAVYFATYERVKKLVGRSFLRLEDPVGVGHTKTLPHANHGCSTYIHAWLQHLHTRMPITAAAPTYTHEKHDVPSGLSACFCVNPRHDPTYLWLAFACAQDAFNPFVHSIAGAAAGSVAAACSNPLDVIKTRLQVSKYMHAPIHTHVYVISLPTGTGK
jgi:hypothetical protein